jgi:hypothetical protein
MSEFAIACCDATMIITSAINITTPMARIDIEFIIFGFLNAAAYVIVTQP